MQPAGEPARALARRLRSLRERQWSELGMTQRQLAEAIGGEKPVSVSLISAWESLHRPVVPPPERLDAYAAFFATRRSVEQPPFRLLQVTELTEGEQQRYQELKQQLLAAREAALRPAVPGGGDLDAPIGGPWQFGDGRPVTMVCAVVPGDRPRPGGGAGLHRFVDLDALFELHGHIRAANPASLVTVRSPAELMPDDYTAHLVLLGAVDGDQPAGRSLRDLTEVPVSQVVSGSRGGWFAVAGPTEEARWPAEHTSDGAMAADVGHFLRAPNPFNRRRTLTVCNGLSSRGVLGAVRALTDARFRERNAGYLTERFAAAEAINVEAVSILMRVQIVGDVVLTPDWTRPGTRCHDWPETRD